MLALIDSEKDAVDLLLMLAGGGVVLAWLIGWWRARPRDPLRGAPIRLNVLSPAWLWLALLCYGMAILVAQSVAQLYAPAGLDEENRLLQQSILAGLVMQTLVVAACLWILRQTFVAGWRGAGLSRRRLRSDVCDGVLGFLVAFSLCTMTAWLTTELVHLFAPSVELPVHTVFETLERPETPPVIGFAAISGALLLAPLAEELLFRGIFQTGLHRVLPARFGSLRHRWAAIAIASFLFGLLHLPVPQHVPALTVLALILGYQYERTGSLIVPIIVHMLFNGKSLLWHALG